MGTDDMKLGGGWTRANEVRRKKKGCSQARNFSNRIGFIDKDPVRPTCDFEEIEDTERVACTG